MNLLQIIKETPFWVWLILAEIVYVGIINLRTRIIYLPKLFIIPFILLMVQYQVLFSQNILEFCLSIIGGTITSFLIHARKKIKVIKNIRSVEVPGSSGTLIILLSFFIIQYYFGYLKAVSSQLFFKYALTSHIISGLFSGYFIGRALCYSFKYWKSLVSNLKCFLLIIFIWSGNTTMASDKTINSPAMFFNVNGKTAIITGVSQGLGKQFAVILNKAGARVILASRDIDKLNAFSKELKNSKAIQMDVANLASVKAAFAALAEAGEKIDICINNAATGALTPIFEEDEQNNFESIIQTNLMGVWYVTKAVANHMKNHGIHGSIINIGSVNGDSFPYKELTAYATSKAAVIHMAKSLVTELSRHKIRINSIAPGLFHTPMTDHKLGTDQQRQEFAEQIPMGFVATPKDLDGALLLLASNAHSSYITGVCITVDGGKSFGTSWGS